MQTNSTDTVFAQRLEKIPKFSFNQDVADVFDDMLTRSIPFYDEIHKIIIDLARYGLKENNRIYDLGCSTGETMLLLDKFASHNNINVELIGIDNSEPMIEKAHTKLKENGVRDYNLFCKNIEAIDLLPAEMIIMNYTLQFIDREKRKELLKRIYEALKPGQFFILAEKINCVERDYRELVTELYYDFKRRNGYSNLEISQKREALENVLIPLSPDENTDLLRDSGFKRVEMIFRWYNFACFLGTK